MPLLNKTNLSGNDGILFIMPINITYLYNILSRTHIKNTVEGEGE
jgi:hypothetical protein